MINECNNLLIDGKNCVYRAIYAGLSDKTFVEKKHHPAVIFFRFITSYVFQYRPNNIHIFWDAPKETLWRKRIYPEYKEKRNKKEDVEKTVEDVSLVIKNLLPLLGVRMYEIVGSDGQEADDLIYSYCRLYLKQSNLIISSDGDFKQIVYQFKNAYIYNPLAKKFIDHVDEDPVDNKCFQGENGDNIDGYEKIGEVNAGRICESIQKKVDFLKFRGSDIYIRNRKLIDLAMCPYLCENMVYVAIQSVQPIIYDRKQFVQTLYDSKVRGITSEVNNILKTFKRPSILG